MSSEGKIVEVGLGFWPERTTKIETLRYLGRIRSPRGTNEEKREEKKEER